MKEIDLGKFIVGLSKIKNESGLSVAQFNAIDKLALDCCKLKEIPALEKELELYRKALELACKELKIPYLSKIPILEYWTGNGNIAELPKHFLNEAKKEI